MGEIKIFRDPENIYEEGSIHPIEEIVRDFEDCNTDELMEWLYGIPIPAAIDFICKSWGLDYEFV